MGNYSMEWATLQSGIYQKAIRIRQPSIVLDEPVENWREVGVRYWMKLI